MSKLDTGPFALGTALPGQRPRSVAAVRVTLGRQPPDRLGQGYPIAKDRLWLASMIADGVKVQGRAGNDYTQRFLPLHADFARFNHDPFLAIEQWDDKTWQPLLKDLIEGLKVEEEIEACVERRDMTRGQADEALRVAGLLRRALAQIPEAHRPTWRAAMETHRKTRRTIRGVIVHRHFLQAPPTPDDAGWLRLAAQDAKPTRGESLIPHPQKLPSCISSDGKTAHRWDGKAYVARPCLAERCPFREQGSARQGSGQACTKTITLVFQLRWPTVCWRCSKTSSVCPECQGTGVATPMPSALAEIECSGGFNFAAKAIDSFFEDVDRQWKALDLPGEPDYIGLPFVLQMAHKTGEGKAYWTAHMSYDFEPGQSFQTWAFTRAQMRAAGRQLMAAPTVALLENAETPRESYARTRIEPASVPGGVIDG